LCYTIITEGEQNPKRKGDKKMNLREAMTKYMENLLNEVDSHNISLENLFECGQCPFREVCHANEDNCSCGEFIKSQLSDGNKYRA
jgi:hypothetical protein